MDGRNKAPNAGLFGSVAERASASFAAKRSIKRHLLAEIDGSVGAAAALDKVKSRWPGNPNEDPDFASALFADYCRRLKEDDPPSIADYQRKYPSLEDSLGALMRQHSVLRSISAGSTTGSNLRLPSVGDELFGFQLCHELGRGAFARVYLARQSSLADRPVVLKISAIDGDEPQTLAQLQHTNIVPIHSVHDDQTAGLRAVCMPYLGGDSLNVVLQHLWKGGNVLPTDGGKFVDALKDAAKQKEGEGQDKAPLPALASKQSTLAELAKLSYPQVAAWIVARVAAGLQHAHDRGILHRDIKPSNILIGGDGEPMLLDFNLAQNPQNSQAHAMLGGTVAYMAPEHLRALASHDPARSRLVDRPADIYALGMVLFEMLTGVSPFQQSASYTPLPVLVEAMAVERSQSIPSLRKQRPEMPWSLESIVRKCLAADPANRYQQAQQLADDLQCYLTDQTLKHAPELSKVDRARKWIRRHPRLTSSGSVASAAILLVALIVSAGAGVREQLAHAHAREAQVAYAAGTERALCYVNTTTPVKDHLRLGLQVCEETLGLYQVLGAKDWQEQSDWWRLPAEDQHQLAEDTRELLLLLAWAKTRTATDKAVALPEALELLDRADEIAGLEPSPALWRDRALYESQLGHEEAARRARQKADAIPARSARDHYLLATLMIRDLGQLSDSERQAKAADVYKQALEHLDEAIRLNPRHYWSWVQRGICRLDLGQTGAAAGDFGVCVGLSPDFAWGYFNRGVCLGRLGQRGGAIADYSAALERDPDFLLARLNRGLAYLEAGQQNHSQDDLEHALTDFGAAIAAGYDGAAAYAGRGGALEGLERFAEADVAFQGALARVPVGSSTENMEARHNLLLQYAFAVSHRLKQEAATAFARVLDEQPGQPKALYGEAMLLAERGDIAQAIRFFNDALTVLPDFVEARRYRAILLARQEEFKAAADDINWCLDHDANSGATVYAAACVSSLMAERVADPAAAEKARDDAFNLLSLAFQMGYGRSQASEDPDLAGLKAHPRFAVLFGAKGV